MARPTLPMLMARVPPLPMCPSQTATGRAIAPAITMAAADSSTCAATRAGTPPPPVQLAGSANHSITPPMSGSPPPCPRRHDLLQADQHGVGEEGKQHTQDGGYQNLGLEQAGQPAGEQVTQSAESDDRADRGQCDGRDRRHA